MTTVTTHQAKTHLSRLLAEVADGGEVVIARGRTPVARLVPWKRKRAKPSRPAVGEKTSGPVKMAPGALDPMGADELAAWGV